MGVSMDTIRPILGTKNRLKPGKCHGAVTSRNLGDWG